MLNVDENGGGTKSCEGWLIEFLRIPFGGLKGDSGAKVELLGGVAGLILAGETA